MVDLIVLVAAWLGLSLVVSGVVRLALVPFALGFEVAAWRARRRGETVPEGRLSVVVPCYNEGRILEQCIVSLAGAVRASTEIILVDDGSTDDTWEVAQRLARRFDSVRALTKANGGKGSALNAGLEIATGEFLLLTDADGIWVPGAMDEILRGMADPRVGAVCGDDRPVNLDVSLTKFLAVTGHVGTGLMRRALTVLRCLPIVSGNVGCFRREALEQVGPLRTDTLGEDLELTWRVQEAGWRVVFRPRGVVYAESPATAGQLWRQRVRWARGLLQTIGQHRRVIGNPRYGIFGLSLLPLVLGSVVLPIAQLLVLPLIAVLAIVGVPDALPTDLIAWLLWVSLPIGFALVVLACALDRSLRDLRFVWTLPFWPIFSIWMSWVAVQGIWLELRGVDRSWNKFERAGVVSIGVARDAVDAGSGSRDGSAVAATGDAAADRDGLSA